MALARLAAEHIDRGITGRHVLFGDGHGIGLHEGRDGPLDLEELPDTLHPFFHFLEVGFVGIPVIGVKGVQPGRGQDAVSRVFQALGDAHVAPVAHLAAAPSALHSHSGTRAVQRDFFFLKGQHAVVFQQHHALDSGLPGQGAVFVFQRRDVGDGRR